MANGEIIRLDTATMRAAAKSLGNLLNVIKNCYDEIKRESDSLKSVWKGTSADTYFACIGSLFGGIETYNVNQSNVAEFLRAKERPSRVHSGNIMEILQEYIHELNYVAGEYDRNEGKLTDRASGLRTDVFDI